MTPVGTARSFLDALRTGDEEGLWRLFTENARLQILALGDKIGVPADVIARMRLGTVQPSERTAFLVDVLEGIRADFAGTDLATLEPESAPENDAGPRVALVHRIESLPGFRLPPIPAAWLRMEDVDGAWLIDHIEVPR